MTLSSRLLLLLALGYLFVGIQGRMVIGYRTAAEEEAVQINEKNTPFRDPAFHNLPGGSQIGNAIYLGSEPAGWRGSPTKKNWYCVFKADEARFNAAAKVWIPQFYTIKSFWGSSKSKELWGYGEKLIAKYIANFGSNTLDIYAKCFATKSELVAYESESVNFWDWTIKEDPGNPG
ncbi:hypothetical protein CSAL01_06142 [Colletotrichum salicis]|uniref:Uncharacterized protein n=1 Tax=Colletotrichum salicis TaxID=1209931 RepID=A0A135V2B8_9PEZI|nr:hypothetical protein CSAL01_06142 [Colletotrichum salicis]